MSQNNYTLIQQVETNLYEISNRDADTGIAGWKYKAKTLKKAIEIANKLEKECWLGNSEYGIQINLLPDVKSKFNQSKDEK